MISRLDPERKRDARDGAMMLLGYAAALRGIELVGLDWQRAGGRAYGGTGFVSAEPEGLLVTLLTSKASQLTPVQLAIPDREMPTLRTWLDQWIAHARVQLGEPLFRPIDRHQRVQPTRLAGESVAAIGGARECWPMRRQRAWRLKMRSFSLGSSAPTACAGATAHRRQMRGSRCPKSAHGRGTQATRRWANTSRYRQGWHSSGLEGVGF